MSCVEEWIRDRGQVKRGNLHVLYQSGRGNKARAAARQMSSRQRLQQSLQRYAEVFVSLMINIELKHSIEYQRTVFGK